MTKCKKCDMDIPYLRYYCDICRSKLAGNKPKKSKNLCIGCTNNWYNDNRENGCYGFKNAKIIIKNVYFSLNQVIPNPKWKLSCFNKKY